MSDAVPFCREAGAGAGVVCLHSNASSSSQWRALMEHLAPACHVLAPDSYGAGKSPPWPGARPLVLADEVALIEPVLARAGTPLALVGHSYGAAIALRAAVANPGRVRAMALYEPTLFALVDATRASPNDADGIRAAVEAAGRALDAGDPSAAAERFIDYWMGDGSWQRMPPARQAPIAAAIVNVRGWAHALLREPTPLAAFGALEMPVLYLVGKRSTPAAHAVARLLVATLPRVELLELDDLGHMGPITHAEVVNEAIARFLDRSGALAPLNRSGAALGLLAAAPHGGATRRGHRAQAREQLARELGTGGRRRCRAQPGQQGARGDQRHRCAAAAVEVGEAAVVAKEDVLGHVLQRAHRAGEVAHRQEAHLLLGQAQGPGGGQAIGLGIDFVEIAVDPVETDDEIAQQLDPGIHANAPRRGDDRSFGPRRERLSGLLQRIGRRALKQLQGQQNVTSAWSGRGTPARAGARSRARTHGRGEQPGLAPRRADERQADRQAAHQPAGTVRCG